MTYDMTAARMERYEYVKDSVKYSYELYLGGFELLGLVDRDRLLGRTRDEAPRERQRGGQRQRDR